MSKTCASCGKFFEAKRSTARFCGERCKKRAQRGTGGNGTVVALGVVPAPPAAVEPPRERGPGPLESAARAELEAVGRAETLAGGVVLALARRIDQAGPDDTGSGFAALTKELRASLAAAVAGAEQSDEVDQVRRQREEKRRGRTG